MFVEKTHQFLRIVANHLVAVNEFAVAVAQVGNHVRETAFQMEEYRTPTDERLEVSVNVVGKELVELGEQLRLAARPFQERLCLNAGNIGRIGKLQRLLLVIGVERTVGMSDAGFSTGVVLGRRKLGEVSGKAGFGRWIRSLI